MGKYTTSQNSEFQNRRNENPLSPTELLFEKNKDTESSEKHHTIAHNLTENINSETAAEDLLQNFSTDEYPHRQSTYTNDNNSLGNTNHIITDTVRTNNKTETETDLLQSILGSDLENTQTPQVAISDSITELNNNDIEPIEFNDAIYNEAIADELYNITDDQHELTPSTEANDSTFLTNTGITESENESETDLLESILGNEYQDNLTKKTNDDYSLTYTSSDIANPIEPYETISNETDLLQSILGSDLENTQTPQIAISDSITKLSNDDIYNEAINTPDKQHELSPSTKVNDNTLSINTDITEFENESEADLLQSILGNEYQDNLDKKANDNYLPTYTSSDIENSIELSDTTSNETDLLHRTSGDENNEPLQNDSTNSIETISNENNKEIINPDNTVESYNEKRLLQDILGDKYQDNQSLQPDNNYSSNNKEIINIPLANDNTDNPLDQKIFTFESLWSDLSATWPAIYNHPEIKIKIEDLWDSLKENNNYLPYISNNILNNSPVITEYDNLKTSDDDTSEYDINLHIAGIYNEDNHTSEISYVSPDDENQISNDLLYEATSSNTLPANFETSNDKVDLENPDTFDNLSGEYKPSINLQELGITDLHSTSNPIDNNESSDLELINAILHEAENAEEFSILSDTDTQEYDHQELVGTNNADEILNANPNKDEWHDDISKVTNSETQEYNNEKLIDTTNGDEPLSTMSIEITETENNSLEEITGSNTTSNTDQPLHLIPNEIPDPVTNTHIINKTIKPKKVKKDKKQVSKPQLSKTPRPNYSATLKKNIRYVSHDISKSSISIPSRRTKKPFVIAVIATSISIASWLYFKEDKEKITSTSVYTTQNSQTSSALVFEKKSTDINPSEYKEIDHVDEVYPDSSVYGTSATIDDTDTKAPIPPDTKTSSPQDTATSYIPPIYQDSLEYDITDVMTDIESPSQTDIEAASEYDTIENNDDLIISTQNKPEISESEKYSHSKNKPEPAIKNRIVPAKRNQSWALNLSSIFTTREPAEKIINLLRNKNIPAEIKEITINGKTWNRIRITGFDSKQDALNYMAVIREKTGIKKYWINKLHTQQK